LEPAPAVLRGAMPTRRAGAANRAGGGIMNRNRAVLFAVLAAFVLVLAPAAWAIKPLPPTQVPLSPNSIPQFVQPLPVLGTGIPVVDGMQPVELSICEFLTNILPVGTPVVGAVPTGAPATWVWGYQIGSTCAPNFDNTTGSPLVQTRSYLGPVIVASRGTPTQVTYSNRLGTTQPGNLNTTNVLAYQQGTDQTLMWADPLNPAGTNPVSGIYGPSEKNYCAEWVKLNPGSIPTGYCSQHYEGLIAAAPHLHGGEIPAVLDGGPDAWWTASGIQGHGFYTGPGATTGQAVYRYPNGQEAAPIWFHDHTLGATRLNVYAGIAGAYMIVDPGAPLPGGMTALGLTNGPDGGEELLIPIVLQDRMFDVNGQLLFPNVGLNPDHPFWIPEFVGDTIVVNGKAWPYHTVEPKRYRFLFLNGSNARSYELSLVANATKAKPPALYVIGTDQGYLDSPVMIAPNAKLNNKLVMMPGERYEVIIDFASLPVGSSLLLSNTAKTPYPAGAPPKGSTLGRIMEFRVGGCTSGFCGTADTSYNPASAPPLNAIRSADPTLGLAAPIVRLADPLLGVETVGTTIHKVRRLTLNEVIAKGGPVEILVNNTPYTGASRLSSSTGGLDFTAITTQWNTTYYSELPNEGETELWEIVNLTADAHPIHPHLVGFQLMNRQAFDVKGYNTLYNGSFPGMVYKPGYGPPLDYNTGTAPVLGGNPPPTLLGLPRPPTPAEAGWKDTVMALPGEVTRFLVRFAPAGLPNNTPSTDSTAAYAFNPNGGHGFVWHCHIIDHEDNEMMRPFSVQAQPGICDPYHPTTCSTAPQPTRTYVRGLDY
jgi:spore coat protein A, manganese oxidase